MSIEDQLQERETSLSTYIPLVDIPNEVFVKVENCRFKTDQKGNDCFYAYLKQKDNRMIVQKYTPTSFKELREALKKAGGIEALGSKFWAWKKYILGRNKFARLLPQPKPKASS